MNINPNKYMLIDNGVPKIFQNEVAKGIRSVGRSGLYAIKTQKLIYALAQKTSDVFPELKGVTPRGYPNYMTWDDVGAVSAGGIVGCFSKPKVHEISTIIRHETGHEIDRSFAKTIGIQFTETKGFTDTYLSDLGKLKERLSNEKIKDKDLGFFKMDLEYITQGSTPQEATAGGKQETFAEIYAKLRGGSAFARRLTGGDKMLEQLFPNTVAYVQKLLHLLGDK